MSKLPITSRGKKWELLNSWWILTAIFFFGFVGFFYIGSTTKQKKWTVCGAVYLAIWIISIYVIQNNDLGVTIYALGWIISIVHSFLVRKQYLIRREYVVKNKTREIEGNAKLEKLQQTIRKEYEEDSSPSSQELDTLREHLENRIDKTVDSAGTEKTVSSALELIKNPQEENNDIIEEQLDVKEKLNINNCTIQQLAELPGVSIVMAKKADIYRADHNGFFSIDEFFAVTEIKPHFVEQIQNRIICGEMMGDSLEKKTEELNNTVVHSSSRKDIESKEKKGRVLDF